MAVYVKLAGITWNIEATKEYTWEQFEALYKNEPNLKRVNLQKLYDRIQGCKGTEKVEKVEAKKVVKKTIKKKP